MNNIISCDTSYTSVSCNRYSHCIDCNTQWICFAAKHSIAIYDPRKYKVIKLLNGHKNKVNSVKWIASNDNLIISSSSDKTAIIWRLIDCKSYEIKYKLIGHKESLIISDSIELSENELISITSSIDRTVRVWINETQTYELSLNNFIFDFKIINKSIFPDIVIITVGANENIEFFQLSEKCDHLKRLTALKGHEDWIRSIDIHFTNNGNLMIATASQDCFIRVHQIEPTNRLESDINQSMFSIQKEGNKKNYLINLETVLAGHEGWVCEVRWHNSCNDSLQLLSASMDKTMILWQKSNESGLNDVWVESVRVGEVGGNTLGFVGCASSTLYNYILGHSFNGAIHLWKFNDNQWKPCIGISAHFDEVTDIVWEPKGEYLLSCSLDQTTRLHSIWISECEESSWHEIARPQIHGYDLKCIAMINRQTFVSGADEKVLRLFRATKCFANSLKKISNVDICSELKDSDVAHSASVPTLGLSNSAVYESNQIEHDFKPTTLDIPPTEETLLQNTLWPEIQKLYGHGYELFSVCCNSSGTLLCSSCKASKSEHANIILWDIKEAKQLTQLASHQLTVTRIKFSHNDLYILSVSRDRTWSLFKANDNKTNYFRIAFSDKKTAIHSRIIWDCVFTYDDRYFVTVSRDKTAIVWSVIDDNESNYSSNLGPVKACDNYLTLSESITTVDILNYSVNDYYLIAFGLENGNICLYYWNPKTFWTHLLDIEDSHTLTVNRIQFSPKVYTETNDSLRLNIASCGADNCLKIFTLLINQIYKNANLIS